MRSTEIVFYGSTDAKLTRVKISAHLTVANKLAVSSEQVEVDNGSLRLVIFEVSVRVENGHRPPVAMAHLGQTVVDIPVM